MALNFNTQTALVTVYAWGAGGAGGTIGGWAYGSPGGGGGFASGKMVVKAGELYQIVVGGGGIVNMGGLTGNGYAGFVEGGGAGPIGTNANDNRYAGSGGGYSGVFLNVTNTQTTALIIAGGGGGGGSSRAGIMNNGGAGGGVCGQKGQGPYDWTTYSNQGGGNGGTQLAGGAQTTAMSIQGAAGSALFGGRPVTNSLGGGGGGGWFGGAGGGYIEANTMAGGGGGSGYINSSTVYCGVLITGCLSTPACSTNTYRGIAGNGGKVAQGGEFGRIVITYPGVQQAQGGTVTTSSGLTIHTFDRSGVFALYGTPIYGTTSTQVEMLIVGGGGGGGTNMGGGGGGGAVVSVYSTLTTGAYLVNVGAGGRGFCGTCAPRGGQGMHSSVVRNYQNSYSYHFDGIADYIYTTSTVSPVSQFSVMGTSNALLDQNFTYEGWYWFMDGSTQRSNTMMMNYNAGAFGSGYIYYGKHSIYDGKVTFWAGSYSTAFPMLIDPIHPPTGRWVHYAVSRNGTNFTLFRDGVAVAANTTATSLTPPMIPSLYIGNNGSSMAQNFRGYMSNLRLTNGNSVYTTGVNTATTSTLFYSGVFNGLTDYLSISDAPALRASNNPFTIEAWINLPRLPQTIGSGGAYSVAQKGSSGFSTYEWGLLVSQSTSTTSTYNLILQKGLTGTSTITTSTSAPIPITSGTWAHVALAVTGTTAYFWFNGISAGTSTVGTASIETNQPFTIGGQSPGINLLPGYISNVRFTRGAALYQTPFTPSTTPLTTATSPAPSLLTLQNSRFIDNSPAISSLTTSSGYVIDTSAVVRGSTSYIGLSNTNLNLGTGDFTIEMWGNLSAIGGLNCPLTFSVAGSVVLRIDSAWTSALVTVAFSTVPIPTVGQWFHYSLSRLGGTAYVHINGQMVGSAANSSSYSLDGARIGTYNNGANQEFIGYLTNIRVTKGSARYLITDTFVPERYQTTNTNTVLMISAATPGTIQDISATPTTLTYNGSLTAVSILQTSTFQYSTSTQIGGFTVNPIGTPGIWTNSPFSTATQVFTVPTDQLSRVQSSSTNLLGTSVNAIMDRTLSVTGSIALNGSTDYVSYPANPVHSPSGPFTLEAYVYLQATAYGTLYMIASNWNNGVATACAWKLGVATTGYLAFSYGIGGTNATITGTTQQVPLNRWVHVAAVRDTTNTIRLYVNGTADATSSVVSGTLNNSPTYGPKIGSDDSATHGVLTPWIGLITGVRFVAGEAVWTSNFTPPQRMPGLSTTSTNTTLLVNFPYNIVGNTAATYFRSFSDSSNYKFQPTLVGTPYPVHWSPYNNTGSVTLLTAQSPLVPVDYSYFGNNIVRGASNNNVTATTFSPFYPELTVTPTVPITTGLNYSAYFDGYGNGSNILVTSTNFITQSLSLPLDFTIECWINTNGALDNNSYILNKGGGTSIGYASYGISIGWPNVYFMASTYNVKYDIGGDSTTELARMGSLQPNTWNHIAVTRQGGTFRGFVNGVQGLTSSTTATTALFDTGVRGLAIGSNYGTNWGNPANLVGPYSGYISNLRIIRGQALYTGNFTPPTQALTTTTVGTTGANVTATITGTVLLMALQSPSIADNSGFGYTLGVTGSVYPQTQNPFNNVTSLGPTSALAMGGGGGASNYSNRNFPASIGANGGGAAGQGRSDFTGGGAAAPGVMGIYGGGFTGSATTGTNIHFPGGGGGAGGSGFSGGVFTTGAKGGTGVPSTILGSTYYFGGGGGGGGYTRAAGCGGRGGGGGGAPKSTSSGGYGDRGSIFRAQDGGYGTLVAVTNQPGGWAAPNSGGGGGGGSHQTTFGGAGGSGIVVIKYPGPQRALGGVVTTVGTSTVHTFYNNDVFTMLGTPIYPMAMGGIGRNGYAGGGQGANGFANYGGPGAPGGALNSGTSVYVGGGGSGGGSYCNYFAGGGGGTGLSGLVNVFVPGGTAGRSGNPGNGGSTSTQFGNGGLFGAGGAGSITCYYNVCWGNGASGAVLITYNTTGTTATTYAFPNPSPAAYNPLSRVTYPYGQEAGVSSSTFIVFSTSTTSDRNFKYAFYNSMNAATVPGYKPFNTGRNTSYNDVSNVDFRVARIPQASCINAGILQITAQVTAHCMMMKNNDRDRPVTGGNQPGNYQVIQEVTYANDPRLVNARVQNFVVGVTGVGCGTSTGVVTSVNQFWTS
jgi:Concanavalin A-like lectin/glucanases superfamily/Glycine rich protein